MRIHLPVTTSSLTREDMRYPTIDDLPMVCQLNLPEAALHVYKDAYNQAWQAAADSDARERHALQHAWFAVRERCDKEALTGQWVPKATPMQARAAEPPAEEPAVSAA